MNLVGENQKETVIKGETTFIFIIQPGINVFIQNLMLINGSSGFGAIHNRGNLTALNCTFTNNSGSYGGAISNEDNCTVNNCNFTGNKADNGGAISNDGTCTIANCNFTNNTTFFIFSTDDKGGAIYNTGTLNVDDCIFTGNNARYGGAIYKYSGTCTVNNCNFTDNNAEYEGSAIYNEGTLSVANSNFTNNYATYMSIMDNGDVLSNHGTLKVTNCTFTKYYATYLGRMDSGGAIYNTGICNIANCTFIGNTATYGGAIYNNGTLDIAYCNFNYNSALYGGAISNEGTCNVNNCNFTGNNAYYGGGAIFNKVNLHAVCCTFTSNNAQYEGGAIYNWGYGIVTYNRITGNTALICSAISGYVEAENNWWGSNNPDWSILSRFTPPNWVILTINVDPNTIYNGEKATIKVDFNYLNDGRFLWMACIPDGPITLSTSWGSFTSSGITHEFTANTFDSVMTATFYANGDYIPSSVMISASADGYTTNETESAYININPTIITSTYNPILETNVQSGNVEAIDAASSTHNTENTIRMQKTGLPIPALLLALLAVFTGLVMPRRK